VESAQVTEKAQIGKGNARKSKLFPLIAFGWILPDLAEFGFGLEKHQ
jgi:hypothetical protein